MESPDDSYLGTSRVQSDGRAVERGTWIIGEDGTVLGQGWQSQWERAQRRLNDVHSVYAEDRAAPTTR